MRALVLPEFRLFQLLTPLRFHQISTHSGHGQIGGVAYIDAFSPTGSLQPSCVVENRN